MGVLSTFKLRTTKMDVTALTTALSISAFADVIEPVLPLVGVGILVGFMFYTINWALALFKK
jgi:hypothetical protein